MTQIDSTAQTDLGISDHEELLLPYKAIYAQLLDTIKEVVSQTLDTAYGTNAPHIATEVLEIALKDNFHSLVMEKKAESPIPQMENKKCDMGDVRLLKMLQQNGLNQPDIFNQTTNQLLRLIELNSLNSEIQKQHCKPFNPFMSYNPVQKMNTYGNILNQTGLFQNKLSPQNNFSSTPKPLQQEIPSQQSTLPPTTSSHPTVPIIPTLQKPFDISTSQPQPKIFSPGVIKSEDSNKTSPSRSPLQAFTTTNTQQDTKTLFNTTTSPFTAPNISKSSTPLLPTNLPHLPSSLNGSTGQMQPPPIISTVTSLYNSPFSSSNLINTHNQKVTTTLSNMEVHQNFIKQMNLINQTAPSMIGQKLMRIPGQEPTNGDIEKVLLDIQVNMGNIKPDPWNAAKDKLYKCPHCETAFARRQYLSNHIINVHNLKTCPECKTTFSNEDAFNAHLAMHPKKEYECGSCNKSFNSVYLLKNHRKTHVKDKPFACNICGKTFADKYYLRNHFSIHSPVKPYSCPVCGRGFASSSALRYHSFQHTGEKPAKCQYCPSEFVQKNQLKLHIARKHKELISSLNGTLHDGDVIPGNISLASSPGSSPARTSPTSLHKTSPLASIVHSPCSNHIMANNRRSPQQAPNQQESRTEEPMQTESDEKPTSPATHIVIPATTRSRETSTVAAATEQLQELIASLQRTSKQPTHNVNNKPVVERTTNKTLYGGKTAAGNFTLSSPFSKITDGINQLLEGSPLAVNETS